MEANTTQRKLRRMAPRVLRVQPRNRDRSPALQAFDLTIVVSATTFIDLFDAVHRHDKERFQQRGQGRGAIETLQRRLREWVPLVARDVAAVRVSEYTERPEVPDDVLRDAKNLLAVAGAHVRDDGTPLPFRDLLLQDLQPLLDAALLEWDEAEGAAGSISTLREQARTAAAAFERDLIAYRKVLRIVIGSSHPDYRKLRVAQATKVDEDDDPNAPALEPEEESDEAAAQ